jgi:glycosyltransferase involved in cell wall biosynthesis
LKVAIAGGIFDEPPHYRDIITTPETNLVSGLRERGIETVAVGLHDNVPHGVDLLHVHHIGRIAVRALVLRIPVVLTRHRHPGVVSAGRRGQLAQWALLRRCDALVTLTDFEASYYRSRLRNCTIRVIPNGIDTEGFSPDPLVQTEPEVLFVGQLSHSKGVFDLIEAFSGLAIRYPDLRLRLISHVQPDREEFLAAVASRGLSGRVTVEEGMSHQDLVSYYRRALVFVLPSLPSHGEALPSVTAEAALTGTPIVCTGIPGVHEQLDDLPTYVPDHSPAHLAEALSQVIENDSLERKRLAEARPKLVDQLSLDRMVDRHLDLYAELTGEGGRR